MAVAGSCPSGAQIVRNFGLLRAAQSDDVCVVNWLVRSLPADWPARCPASTHVPNREPVPLGRRAEHAWIHRRLGAGAAQAHCWHRIGRNSFFLHLKNRGPGRLGCGPPRLLRLHRDTEGGAADVRRHGESSRAGPSVIGKLVCHVKTSPAHDSKPRDARYLNRGTTRWNSRAPRGQTGPLPRKAPGIPSTIQLV